MSLNPTAHSQETFRAAYEKAAAAPWREIFRDSGTSGWKENWFLDGKKGTVSNSPKGMQISAGPIEHDDASHVVLWTKRSFEGEIKLEFDYTRTDTVNRWVNIVYLQATGVGDAPYARDISKWSGLREIPSMKTYYDHMNLLHISFAAYGKDDSPAGASYIRARRYPRSLFGGSFDAMALKPDFDNTGLFLSGVGYHVTVIKKGGELFMGVKNGTVDKLYRWDLSGTPPVSGGRVGFRLMWLRSGLFSNISIGQLADSSRRP